MDEGTTPTIWRTSVIKPIHKISDSKVCNDYRPIDITCHPCQVLEKLVKAYQFQPKQSTQDALLCHNHFHQQIRQCEMIEPGETPLSTLQNHQHVKTDSPSLSP